MTSSSLPWHRSDVMTAIWPTGSGRHNLETSRVLLNTVQISQTFSQFYLYAHLPNTNFMKLSGFFSRTHVYEVVVECASLSRTSLTLLFAAGPGPELFCFQDSNLAFLWMNIWVSRLRKDNAVKTLFRRNEGHSALWQQVFCSASSSRNTMTCSA